MITIVAKWDIYALWASDQQGLLAEISLWEQVCLCYGVGRIIMVPKIMFTNREQYDSIEEALSVIEGTRVFLEKENRAREIHREPLYLEEFVHPENAVYVFGNTQADNSAIVGDNDLVSVKTPYNGDMYAVSMAALVLNDRWRKSE